MTFSTLVTPTRERLNESVGTRLWTSSKDRVMTFSVVPQAELDEWTKVSPRTDHVSRATNSGRHKGSLKRFRSNQEINVERRTSQETNRHGRGGPGSGVPPKTRPEGLSGWRPRRMHCWRTKHRSTRSTSFDRSSL